MGRVVDRWRSTGAGERYAEERWRTARARERDPRLVRRLLAGVELPAGARVLDVPCGAGRLAEGLRAVGRSFGVDASKEMVLAARSRSDRPVALGDAGCLPFQDGSFDVVVCCRLLHHLAEGPELERIVAELVRVSRRWVVASFWDAASWHAWRRRVGLRASGTRAAVPRSRVAGAFDAAGADVRRFAHSLRFVAPQAFALAEKR